jgi:hypothetical protein
MKERIDAIFQQVMDENCKNPLYRFAELVRQDEREQLKNRTPHEQQLMEGQASLLKGRTE